MKPTEILLCALISIFAFPSFAFANPMTPVIGIPGIFIALALESILLTLLVKSYSIRPSRFMAIWFLITSGTFAVMSMFIYGVERIHMFANMGITILVAELLVVLAEAAILRWLLKRSVVLKQEVRYLGFGRALGYSFIVNLVSFIAGFVMLTLSSVD